MPRSNIRKCTAAAATNFQGVSCFTVADLRTIANVLNVDLTGLSTKPQIFARVSGHPLLQKQAEWNWIQTLYENKKYLKNSDDIQSIAFKTFAPSNVVRGREWISSNQIQDYLRQLKLTVEPGLCVFFQAFNEPSQRNAIQRLLTRNPDWKYIACIANTSSGSGTHWVTYFIDRGRATIEYFDSFGDPPTRKKLTKLIWSVLQEMNNILAFDGHTKFKTSVNRKTIQQNGSECGIYAIRYVTKRVSNKTVNATIKDFTTEDPNACYDFRGTQFIVADNSSGVSSSRSSSIYLTKANYKSLSDKSSSITLSPQKPKPSKSKQKRIRTESIGFDVFDYSEPKPKRRRKRATTNVV